MIDWNDFLSYQTPRVVKIRDKRLFFLYVTLLAFIFAYIVIFAFGIRKRYMLMESPLGTIRTSLRHPAPAYSKTNEQLPYCGNDVYIGTDWRVFDQRGCKEMDRTMVVYPAAEASSMLVTTRMTVKRDTLTPGCDAFSLSDNCTWTNDGKKEEAFLSNIDMFTLFLDHTMDGVVTALHRNSRYMEGEMYSKNGHIIDPCDDYDEGKCPKYVSIGAVDKPDIFPLKTLLRAAGVTLDSQANPSMAIGNAKWESRRYAGVVLLLRIFYDNTHSFNPNNVRYTYHVDAIPNTEYKVEQPVLGTKMENGQLVQTRTIVDRHGIRIIFQQSGQVGTFDFQTLLVNAASSLGLIALATVIVDLLATKVLAEKEFYKECKYLVPIDTETYKQQRMSGVVGGGGGSAAAGVVGEQNVLSPLLKEA